MHITFHLHNQNKGVRDFSNYSINSRAFRDTWESFLRTIFFIAKNSGIKMMSILRNFFSSFFFVRIHRTILFQLRACFECKKKKGITNISILTDIGKNFSIWKNKIIFSFFFFFIFLKLSTVSRKYLDIMQYERGIINVCNIANDSYR